MGVQDARLSIVAQHGDRATMSGSGIAVYNNGPDVAGKGLLAGALATTLGASGRQCGSAPMVGGASGAVAGALANAEYNKNDANDHVSELERGGVFVAVDTDNTSYSNDQIRAMLAQCDGRSSNIAM